MTHRPCFLTLGEHAKKDHIPQVLGGYRRLNRGEHHEHQRPASGATGGPGASTKPEHRKYRVFRVSRHTPPFLGHCRASTVSIIDTHGFGGVSRRSRCAPTGEHHEPFISPGPLGPGSGASLMLMRASLMLMTLAWGGGGPRGRKTW